MNLFIFTKTSTNTVYVTEHKKHNIALYSKISYQKAEEKKNCSSEFMDKQKESEL